VRDIVGLYLNPLHMRCSLASVNVYLGCFRWEFVDYFQLFKHPASQLRMAHFL